MKTLWILVIITEWGLSSPDGRSWEQYLPQQMIHGLSEVECWGLVDRATPWNHTYDAGRDVGSWWTKTTLECWPED